MTITTTGNLGPMILQSLAPAMLYVPTPTMNYITICDKVSMPPNGGTTMRFMRPRALQPPTVQLGNSGIDPPAQVPQRKRVALNKSFLMGLKILLRNGKDNKAQAEQYALAA